MKNKPYPLNKIDPVGNLREMVAKSAKKYGDQPAYLAGKGKRAKTVSFRQFEADVASFGTALLELGLRNACMAVLGENSYEWILTYFSVVNGGNVIVPIDKELSAEEMKYLLTDSACRVLVYSDTYADIADALKVGGTAVEHFINMNDLPDLLKKGKASIEGGSRAFADTVIDNKAMTAIIYTSGTTGVSKGVMLSHHNLCSDAVAALQNVYVKGISLLVLPLHHTFSFTAGVLSMLHFGKAVAINTSLKNVSADLLRYKPMHMFVVPLFVETLYKKIWDSAKKSGKDKLLRMLIKVSNTLLKAGIDIRRKLFKSVLEAFGGELDLIVSGGAPLDAKYVVGFREFGINLLNGYGISECSPVVAVNRNEYNRDGSVGQLLPGCEAKILRPDEGGEGEICVRGDIVMLGYYHNEQATREAFEGEWFRTGDIGRIDSEGFLFITGRVKNLIILSNGKNIYPEELEMMLCRIPLVQEVVVYAEGERIAAEIYPDADYLSQMGITDSKKALQDAVDELNKDLPLHKKISKIKVRDTEFVKTTTKKIKRHKPV